MQEVAHPVVVTETALKRTYRARSGTKINTCPLAPQVNF